MKRVLLINPNTEKAPYPVAPVGLCLIAASLKDRYQVRVLDGTFDGGASLRRVLPEFAPDYIGLGIRNIDDVTLGVEQYYIDGIARDFVAPIRDHSDAPVILGGSGFSLFPRRLIDTLGADFGVVGEGEVSFRSLLDCLDTGGDPTSIDGVITAADSPERAVIPARSSDVLDIPSAVVDEQIDFSPYRARGAYPVQTKRGCHLKCVYCSYPAIEGSRYRLRSPEAIVDEIEAAAGRLGDVTFEFVDSTFNAPAGHAERILREIIKRKLTVRLRCMGVNPGGITDRLLARMREAGFAQIVCSADTASEVMLKNLRKGFTRQTLESVATLLRKHDMPTMWSFIFGGPGETIDTIEESFDFIERFIYELDMVHMTEGIRIYPNTPIYDIAVDAGVIRAADSLLRPVFFVSEALGRERLEEIVVEKTRRYPNCIRNIDSSPSPEMIRQAIALKKAKKLEEPMFRTLLRVRRQQMSNGRDL